MQAKWWSSNPLALDSWGLGHRLACLIALLTVIAALFFACWRVEPFVLLLLAGFCGLALTRKARFISFGFLLPLVPGLGPESLFVFAAALAIALCPKFERSEIGSLVWILALLGGWSISALVWWADYGQLILIFRSTKFLAQVNPAWYLMLIGASRLIVLIFLFCRLSKQPKEREELAVGLFYGLVTALLISAIKLIGFSLPIWQNQGAFWQALGRDSGTFSDPNAFGIFTLIALALLFLPELRQRFNVAVRVTMALALLALGLFSGSRSLVLGLLIFIFIYGLRFRPYLVAGATLFWGIILGYLGQTGAFEKLLLSDHLPITVVRILEPIASGNFWQALFSRSAFLQLALAIFRDNPFLGVGLERFREYVPIYGEALGLGIGKWNDNSNNFYLGILAELGFVGVLIFSIALSGLKVAKTGTAYKPIRVALVTFAILLFIGPHLSFDEVSLGIGLLASFVLVAGSVYAFEPRRGIFLVCLLPVCAGAFLDRGFYPWEKEGVNWFRWTSRKASGVVLCTGARGLLEFRALHPGLGAAPLEVILQTATEKKVIQLSDNARQSHSLDCRGEEAVRYKISVSRTYFPKRDPRPLGLQVFGANITRWGYLPPKRVIFRRVWG